MVDITAKEPSHRRAVAWCRVRLGPGAAEALRSDRTVLEGVRMAGLQAAKRTSSLIPLCHPLPLGEVTVDLGIEADALEISVTAETWARTGVEMEALTACALAGLALIDLCDPTGAMIESVALLEKSGGRSGAWAAGPGRRPGHDGSDGSGS